MLVSSLIYDYLDRNGYTDLIEQYGLQHFGLDAQAAERTLVDKGDALGDYYLSDAVHEHSRYMYDIYKLLDVVSLNDSMKELVQSIFRKIKSRMVLCPSGLRNYSFFVGIRAKIW